MAEAQAATAEAREIVNAARATAQWSKTMKQNGESTTETGNDEFPTGVVPEHPCSVSVALKRTVSGEDYSSVSASVHLTVPCAHDELDTAFAFADQWCTTKLAALFGEEA